MCRLCLFVVSMPVRDIIAARFGVEGSMNKSRVCRCLFGKPNHDEVRKDLDEQLKNISKDFKTTWNFDPDLDKPLDGRYEWSLAADAPEFFRKGYRPTRFVRRRHTDNEDALKFGSDSEPESEGNKMSLPVERLTGSNDSEEEKINSMDLKRENEKTPEAQIVRQTRIPGKT